jgi:hypothetical protein
MIVLLSKLQILCLMNEDWGSDLLNAASIACNFHRFYLALPASGLNDVARQPLLLVEELHFQLTLRTSGNFFEK